MAIVTDRTVTRGGLSIGISKNITQLMSDNEFTVENLTPFMFAGQLDRISNRGYSTSSSYSEGSAAQQIASGVSPLIPRTSMDAAVFAGWRGSMGENTEFYGRNILLYTDSSWAGTNQHLRSDDGMSNMYVVTDVNIKKLYFNTGNTSTTINAVTGDETSATFRNISGAEVLNRDNDQSVAIAVYTILIDGNNNWYLYRPDVFPYNERTISNYRLGSGWDSAPTAFHKEGNVGFGRVTIPNPLPDFETHTNYLVNYASDGADFEIDPDLLANYGSGTSYFIYSTSGAAYTIFLYTPYAWGSRCIEKEEDVFIQQLANAGLYFKYDNTMYKPLASGGFLDGYTTDMSQESDWDDITNVTGNTVPITPPGPTPPGPGYDDDPWSGATFSGVGVGGAGAFAKCYYMTSTELANLRSWMNSNNVPEGFDPMAQIIGLSQVPVSLSGDDNTTVQFVNSSAVYDPGVTRVVDSGVSTQISMGTPKRYSLGSVNITRRMQERGEPYLDYDCQIELYLPLIGMFSLDTQAVMGRTITAEAVLDPISGTLAAYAYVTRDGQNLPIAYGSTTIGVDLPISAQQYSVARAALKQANAQLGTSLLSSTLSLIAAATAGGKGSGTGAKTATGSTNGLAAAGIREAGADYMKASQAGNVFGDFMQWGRTIRQLSYGNNTAIAGSFGGSTAQWSYPFTPYVKIIRPRYEKPRNYNRSQGVPCVQTKTVGSCTGFIQCIGVEVKGITGATDIELQAIQAALSNGVFAGGGS